MDKNLGPLAILEGRWEGVRGTDTAPDANRESMDTPYRETITFRPTGLVTNHEQELYGLAYQCSVWPEGKPDPFHEESGFWLWDAASGWVMRSFTIPRGQAVLAGGEATADSTKLALAAEAGSETWGIVHNPFLQREFRTVRFECEVTIHDENCFSYSQDTQLAMPGREALFHHRDNNRLTRIA